MECHNLLGYYHCRETCTNSSVQDNIEFIEYLLAKKVDRVQPIITPRFAITCDMALMKKLGELAERYKLNIQSHISENLGEVSAVKEFYPESKNYSDVYDEAKLLTNRCVMAHGVHLEDEELKVFSARGSSVAHCPTSNTNLGSGICDVKRLLKANVKVGLGTDVSGGNRIGIIDVMRAALDVSHHLNMMKKQDVKGTGKVAPGSPENEQYVPMNYKQVVYLATLGGAEGKLCYFLLLFRDKTLKSLVIVQFGTLIQKFVMDARMLSVETRPVLNNTFFSRLLPFSTKSHVLVCS